MSQVNVVFKQGAYNQAADKLLALKNFTPEQQGEISYWLGICYSKLQRFDEAISAFTAAARAPGEMNKKFPSLNYELGQANYAANNLESALHFFATSIKQRYMTSSAHYYRGFIYQLLERPQQAISSFRKVNPQDREVFQSATFQVAEIIYTAAKKKPTLPEQIQVVQEFLLPQLERSLRIDPTSMSAGQIKKRTQEILDEFGLDRTRLVNGRRLSAEATSLDFRTTLAFDNNVITEAEEAPSKAAPLDKQSAIVKSELKLNYRWAWWRRLVMTPELKFNYDYYANRNTPNVYRNDSYIITPSLENKWEHTFRQHPATFILDAEYAYQAKDVRMNHELIFYGRTPMLTIGEKWQVFAAGESSFKWRRKFFRGQSTALNSTTDSLIAAQNIMTSAQHLLLLLASADFTSLPNDPRSSSNSYTLRADYLILDFFSFRPQASFSYSLMDTKEQWASRGLEQTFAPSLALARSFLNGVHEVTLKYDYTKNTSKNKMVYAYSKSVYSLEWQIRI